ncbi:MAG TPA: sugar transferase [Burkholderiaceae bacterium]|nr:sugar transferase [Burkholderiaceae bacterium]
MPERPLARVCALLLLVLITPLLALIAALVWLEDRGPVVFAQYRIGRNGRPFRCFKFRSMVSNADSVLCDLLANDARLRAQWERDQKLEHDPRVTRIGRLLRVTSLDELPQLYNIWRGEMAFVGPRPIVAQELARYGVWKRHYLRVCPGLTGLWQVSGRNDVSYDERVALDRDYVEHHSWLLDLLIVGRTFGAVLRRHGAR